MMKVPLQDAVRRFLREHEEVTQSFKTYGYVLNPMAEVLGPKRPVSSISILDISDYSYELKKKTYRGKPYSKSTVIYHENVVKIFFRWCEKFGLIKASPADALKGGTQPASKADEKAMKEDELALLLEFARWDKRLYALLLFLAHTGCRAEGASSLRLKDIDLAKGEAVVTEKASKQQKQRRTVLFGPMASEAIQVWLDSRARKHPLNPEQTVFSITGKPITSSVVSGLIGRACDKVEIRHMGAHSIRHRFGHMMAMRGVPPSITAVFMGHSDPVTTLRVYYPRDLETGRDAWERFVSGKPPILEGEAVPAPQPVQQEGDSKIIYYKFR